MKVNDVVKLAEKYSEEFSETPIPRNEIFTLLSYFSATAKHCLFSDLTIISPSQVSEFLTLIKARATGVPLSQIIKERSFWNSKFTVDKNVLDPRPESETLIEVALRLKKEPTKILDLGTGSGCLACSLSQEYPLAQIIAVDKSPIAISLAKKNSEELNLKVDFIVSDWFMALSTEFDLIICNPPYLSLQDYTSIDVSIRNYEPIEALIPLIGENCTGYESYTHIATEINNFLSPGGYALFEVGDGMASTVKKIFSRNEGHFVDSYIDLNGIDRVVSVLKM